MCTRWTTLYPVAHLIIVYCGQCNTIISPQVPSRYWHAHSYYLFSFLTKWASFYVSFLTRNSYIYHIAE